LFVRRKRQARFRSVFSSYQIMVQQDSSQISFGGHIWSNTFCT